jgi:hypothetical protein
MTFYAPIGLKWHALIDIGLVIAGLSGPFVLDFSHLLMPTLYCFAASLVGFVLNSITDYPIGIWRKVPFSLHQAVEWTSPVPFIAVPWMYFSDAGAMPYFLSAIGVVIFLNATLTRPRKLVAA